MLPEKPVYVTEILAENKAADAGFSEVGGLPSLP
jgi:hypothetical protein